MSKKSSPVPKVKVRMVWRLVLSLFLHLTLLLFLAIYLELALTSVRHYAPAAMPLEATMESANSIPALLDAMDAERRIWQRTGDPRDLARYTDLRLRALRDLDSLSIVLADPTEQQRRTLARQWLAEIGTLPPAPVNPNPSVAVTFEQHSQTLLHQLDQVTDEVRLTTQATLANLQSQEADEAAKLANLMWIGVGSVSLVTIIFQLFVANSIISPIQTLAAAVRRLQSGDYSARVHLNSGDEIESLAETFNAMAQNIVRNQNELEEKNARLSSQQEALRQANATLEGRVAEKTGELEETNQKLTAAARLKDEFLATLSHELRTPLTPVISCAHLLGTDDSLNPEQIKNVRVIDRNARALSRMIDELLDLSAVMNRKLLLMRERTEMNEWARATVESLRALWKRKNLVVTFTPASQPVELDIDPTRLSQVLTNLVSNAIKYTPAKGQITVTLTTTSDELRIAVSDTGAGLARHEIDQIFEMFHQSRTSLTEGVGGLGVGLTVARSLAELHGGGLLAESPGHGKGATFTLWLPLRPTLTTSQALALTPPPAGELTPATDRSLLRGRRILLVEDSVDTREALQRIFQRRECQVFAAATAEDGLELALHESPEILISDIGLPGMSGLDLMKRLREKPEFAELIAIALSGLGREQDIQAALEAGFNAHLLKPVDIAVLDETLLRALRR